jgi:hypothetical protein
MRSAARRHCGALRDQLSLRVALEEREVVQIVLLDHEISWFLS